MSEQKVRAAITGTGSYVPERILTNLDLEKMVDTSDEWIFTRSGIRERRIAADGEAASDLGAKAAVKALDDAGVHPDEVSLIITATMTADHCFPSTAALIQDKIGARNAGGFDLQAACAGFVYALSMGAGLVEADPTQTVLLVGTDVFSRFLDWTDRRSCILFGDGGGAAVLRASSNGNGVLVSEFGVDGSGADLMKLPAGGSAMPASEQTVKDRMHYVALHGRELFKFAVTTMVNLVGSTLDRGGMTMDDIKLIVPHQVNIRILQAAAERLGVPMDKMYCNIDRYGNTAAASVPIALDEAVRGGAIARGDTIIFVAFGGGLSWSSAIMQW